jgi:hypothetical protein
MHPSSDVPTPRRGFLGRLLGGAAALAGGGLVARDLAAQQPAAPQGAGARPASDAYDMSWVERVKGAHRQVFDAPEIAGGTILHQARVWMSGFAEVYGAKDADMSPVLVIRHAAIPMVLNDAMWERLNVAKELAEAEENKVVLKDPATGELPRRNPFLNANAKPGDRHSTLWADGGLDTLVSRGAIVLACGLALNRAYAMARKAEGLSAADARTLVQANLLPGVYVMPSGIFAVTRAQEAGCQYIRAT